MYDKDIILRYSKYLHINKSVGRYTVHRFDFFELLIQREDIRLVILSKKGF